MKTIKQIREEYDSVVLDQIEVVSEEIMLEGVNSRVSPIPSSKEMPNMLVFRRIQYRIFPNKQVVALYYSKMINKYLSIPFGPDGNVNLSEAIIIEDESLLEDWQSVNRKDKTDGLSQAAVNAYRRENPGSKLKTAVTEKNPKGKRAARRKSFCSRMGGMKKRLTSAKTARDPDSRINKALRRWNCEEAFYNKLHEKRMQEGMADTAADLIVPYRSAYKEYKQGNYGTAALHAGIDTIGLGAAIGSLGAGSAPAAGAAMAAKTGVTAAAKMGVKGLATKALEKVGLRKAAKAAGPMASKDAFLKTSTKAAAKPGVKAATKGGLKSLVKNALVKGASAAAGAASGSDSDTSSVGRALGQDKAAQAHIKTGTVSTKASQYTPTASSKIKQAELARTKVQENKISDIRNMINEGVGVMELPINGRTIKLNSSMAKRIVEVYDSVNTKNKKVVESMLNEDLESFKRLLNFSIKV